MFCSLDLVGKPHIYHIYTTGSIVASLVLYVRCVIVITQICKNNQTSRFATQLYGEIS